MYIQRVYLKNLKGFRELDFKFRRPDGSHAGWTVLTGDNGSGKTALLKAIALALVGPDVARALQPNLNDWIREGSEEAEIAVQLVVHEMDRFVTGGRRPERAVWSELDLQLNGGPEVSLKPADRRRGAKKGPLNGPWAENAAGWFAVGYGPFRRLYGASPEAQRLMSGPSRVSRFATMFKEDATLLECELWLKDLNYRKLEARRREARVLEQTVSLLNDDFLRNGIRVERIDSDGLWLRDAGDTTLPLSEMSEGYRAALALMIDIMRHVVKMYPEADLAASQNGHLTVPHEGVVLIDEIDAHLHPEWQRKIGYWLKTRFPNMQFIVSSHSALVCQAADPGGIFHLPAPGSDQKPFKLSDEDFQKIKRSKADEVLLSPAFEMTHTRSPEAVDARRKYARLKAKKKSIGLKAAEENQMQLFRELWIGSESET